MRNQVELLRGGNLWVSAAFFLRRPHLPGLRPESAMALHPAKTAAKTIISLLAMRGQTANVSVSPITDAWPEVLVQLGKL